MKIKLMLHLSIKKLSHSIWISPQERSFNNTPILKPADASQECIIT
ncbi:MAG: hypothetical protein LBT10_07345 [Methanobrevibacter sp.]|nr:hypothetical protein [Methanobrevibacter sp.]